MSVPRDIVRDEPGISAWCILHGYRGSIAHGMYDGDRHAERLGDQPEIAPPRIRVA